MTGDTASEHATDPRLSAPLRLHAGPRGLPIQAWEQPLPDVLFSRLSEPARAAHAALLERTRAHTRKVAELTARAASASTHDDAARREALRAGTKLPTPKAPALEATLADERRDLDTLRELLAESGRALLATLDDNDLKVARDEAKRQGDELLTEFAERLNASRADLDRAARLREQQGWCSGLLARRTAMPYVQYGRASGALLELQRGLVGMLNALADELAPARTPIEHHPPSR